MENAKVTKKYTNGEVTVVWEPAKCFHSGVCVRGLNTVFDSKARPWINMEGADSETIVNQVNQCPSGALSMLDENEEALGSATKIQLMPDGPMIVEGNIKMTQGDGNVLLKNRKTAFCRCGASANKPFCDGAHRKIGFKSES